MPTISINCPHLSKEQKAELVSGFTETASKVIKLPKQAFVVYIQESGPENVGVGGELLIEKKKREGTL